MTNLNILQIFRTHSSQVHREAVPFGRRDVMAAIAQPAPGGWLFGGFCGLVFGWLVHGELTYMPRFCSVLFGLWDAEIYYGLGQNWLHV
jgi:hypothetical protein